MFNRHVGNGQPTLNAERANDGACIFDHMAGPARCAQYASDVEYNVFGGHARPKFTFDADFHRL